MSESEGRGGDQPAEERLLFEQELKRYLKADPFHDLEIVTSSGDRYEITSPWQIAIGDNVVVVARGKYGVRMIRKNQIVAVHVLESSH